MQKLYTLLVMSLFAQKEGCACEDSYKPLSEPQYVPFQI